MKVDERQHIEVGVPDLAVRPVIAYGVQGEGRAHAVRALVLSTLLKEHYDVRLYASGQALDFLTQAGCEGVRAIDGVRFPVAADGSVNLWALAWRVACFFYSMEPKLSELAQELQDLHVQAVIADFEPLLSRVAHRIHIPLINLGSQARFRYTQAPEVLPWHLRMYWWVAGLAVRIWVPDAERTIISTPEYKVLHATQCCQLKERICLIE